MKRFLLAPAFLLVSLSAYAADGAAIISEMGDKAISRGYGATCSLEMKPVSSGGYYPCLDFGPYRYVRGYGKVYGLVIQKGKEPFLVLSGPGAAPQYLYDGPWNVDMPARMVMWWNDVVEGRAAVVKSEESASQDKKTAEDYIRKLSGGTDEPKAKAPDSVPEPVPAAAKAPNPGKQEEISPDIKELLRAQ